MVGKNAIERISKILSGIDIDISTLEIPHDGYGSMTAKAIPGYVYFMRCNDGSYAVIRIKSVDASNEYGSPESAIIEWVHESTPSSRKYDSEEPPLISVGGSDDSDLRVPEGVLHAYLQSIKTGDTKLHWSIISDSTRDGFFWRNSNRRIKAKSVGRNPKYFQDEMRVWMRGKVPSIDFAGYRVMGREYLNNYTKGGREVSEVDRFDVNLEIPGEDWPIDLPLNPVGIMQQGSGYRVMGKMDWGYTRPKN